MAAFSARRNAAIDAISEAAAAHANLEGEARSLARQLEQATGDPGPRRSNDWQPASSPSR